MTRYDPFAYGNVPLGKQAPAGEAPEDVLFADAGPVKHAPPAADASWSLLNEDVGNLLPGSKAAASAAVEFGTEILGETVGEAPAAMVPQPPRARPAKPKVASTPAAKPAAKGEPLARPVAAMPSQRPVAAKTPLGAPAAAATPPTKPAEAPRRGQVPLLRRGRPIAALLVPLCVAAAGGTGASWLLVMQQNPVMAAIAGATTIVGAAFAWLLLRG